MAFLLAGVALGATAVALSEADRDYYRTSRYSMDYLGNKNGQDIYKDRVTGYYYADDGYDVRRVGRSGWRPHPVDLERLKGKLAKYSPGQVKFSAYILATYIDKEQALWDTIFKRYEAPKEPKKPTFGKSIRKQRWSRYEEEHDAWEKEMEQAKARYRDECKAWSLRREEFDDSHSHAAVGSALLRHALSSGSSQAPGTQMFKIVVPQGKKAGDVIQVQAGGRTLDVMIPAGATAGTEVQFEIPEPVITNATPAAAPSQPPPAAGAAGATFVGAPPPATGAPPPAMGAPPPAMGAPPPATGAPTSSNPFDKGYTATASSDSAGAGEGMEVRQTSFRL